MRVCVIPARGGSVRIPRKNIRDFRGKPMLQWAVEAAQASELFDVVMVSTDDEEIKALAVSLRCQVHMRMPDDGVKGTQDVVVDVLRECELWREHFAVCTIYPCSPFLVGKLLDRAYHHFMGSDVAHLVSTYPKEMRDAGCFYWQSVDKLISGSRAWQEPTIAFPLPAWRCIDINDEGDWRMAEAMFDTINH